MPIAGTSYLRPGVYIGQVIRPAPSGLPDLPRLPILVGKGNRLARGRNLPMLRSFVIDEAMAFTPVPPYRAVLEYASNRDKEDPRVQLVDDLGAEILKSKWFFVDSTTIEVHPSVYDSNRTYTLDYQASARTPLDPIPVNDIRGEVRCSVSTDQDEFVEHTHFHLPVTMEAAGQDPGVLEGIAANPTTIFAITAAGGNTSVATLSHGANTEYTHEYSRSYTIVCTASVPGVGTSVADFRWSSTPVSGGNNSLPHVPLNPAATTRWNVFRHDQSVDDVITVTLEHGLTIELDMTGDVEFGVGDSWTFTAHAAPRMEIDQRHLGTNQYLDLGTLTADPDNIGTASGAVNVVTSNFTGTNVRNYEIECIATAGVTPNRTASLMVSSYGEDGEIVAATFSLQEAVPASLSTTLAGGVVVDWSFGVGNFDDGTNAAVPVQPVRGDVFTLRVSPPRLFAKVKDDRSYTFQITAVDDLAPGTRLTGIFLTDTPEGKFGSFTAIRNGYLNVASSTTGLPDDVRIRARNISTTFASNLYEVGDQFSFTITNDDVIDWSLVERKTEVLAPASWRFDPSGRITGTLNTWYALLARVPETIITINNGTTTVDALQVAGTGYLYLSAQPVANVTVVYEWRGPEPSPGQPYYLTGNYIRTSDLYNEPILVRSTEEARTLLAPMNSANDLLIGAEAALYSQPAGIYVIQVADADGDLVYEDADYRTAILASEQTALGTDLIILNRWAVLGDALSSVNRMNSPTERKRRLLWVGAPIGTAVGTAETVGSLVYTAQQTLAVYGESDAHGTRILHASNSNVYTIRLDSGQTQQVTLDGSFMSALLAGMVAAFDASWETVMRKTFGFFDSITTYSEANDRILGASQIIYFKDLGAGTFRVEEDFTTDNFSPQFRTINCMTTQHYMSRFVEKDVDSAIGIVPPSKGEGADIVQGLVASAMRKALAQGIIASYQNADGSQRAFDPTSDVIAFSDPGDDNRVQFRFTYYMRKILKVAIGLYTTDGASFNT